MIIRESIVNNEIKNWAEENCASGFMGFDKTVDFCKLFDLSTREAEGIFLTLGYIPRRYEKNKFSSEKQKKLFDSGILIAGCGATGQAYASILARVGVGRLMLLDHDFFEDSNLNRQIFSSELNLGAGKAFEACRSLREINSGIIIDYHNKSIENTDLTFLVKGYDLVIDALDNIGSRLFLEQVCCENNKVLIHSGVSGWCGQMRVIYPGENFLARHFSKKDHGKNLVDSSLGFSVNTLAGIVGSVAVKILTGEFDRLENSFCFFDLEHSDFLFEKVTNE